jgi:hypothetical protein
MEDGASEVRDACASFLAAVLGTVSLASSAFADRLIEQGAVEVLLGLFAQLQLHASASDPHPIAILFKRLVDTEPGIRTCAQRLQTAYQTHGTTQKHSQCLFSLTRVRPQTMRR